MFPRRREFDLKKIVSRLPLKVIFKKLVEKLSLPFLWKNIILAVDEKIKGRN